MSRFRLRASHYQLLTPNASLFDVICSLRKALEAIPDASRVPRSIDVWTHTDLFTKLRPMFGDVKMRHSTWHSWLSLSPEPNLLRVFHRDSDGQFYDSARWDGVSEQAEEVYQEKLQWWEESATGVSCVTGSDSREGSETAMDCSEGEEA